MKAADLVVGRWEPVRDPTTGVTRWAVAGPRSLIWPGRTVEVATKAGKVSTVRLGLLAGAHRKRGAQEVTVLAYPELRPPRSAPVVKPLASAPPGL